MMMRQQFSIHMSFSLGDMKLLMLASSTGRRERERVSEGGEKALSSSSK
jgi:hypothetical protein